MTKSELINEVARNTGLSASQAAQAVNATFEAITNRLSAGDDVRITGFGIFSVTATRERVGRNPRTGEISTIPAGKRAAFKAGARLAEAVRAAH